MNTTADPSLKLMLKDSRAMDKSKGEIMDMADRDALFPDLVRIVEEYRVVLLIAKMPAQGMTSIESLLERARALL